MNSEKVAKELSRSFKNIAYMMQIGGHAVKIVIDADTYDATLMLMEEFVEDEKYEVERVKDEYQAVRLDGYTNTWSAFEKLITNYDTYYILQS